MNTIKSIITSVAVVLTILFTLVVLTATFSTIPAVELEDYEWVGVMLMLVLMYGVSYKLVRA